MVNGPILIVVRTVQAYTARKKLTGYIRYKTNTKEKTSVNDTIYAC